MKQFSHQESREGKAWDDEQLTQRGFAKIEFRDIYHQACSLQMSSLAEEKAVWLGVDVTLEGKTVNARMHLNAQLAEKIIAKLQEWLSIYGEPEDDPAYQMFISEMAKKCRCEPDSDRPCTGLMSDGLCEQVKQEPREERNDDDVPF